MTYNKSLFDTQDGICYITGRKCDTARHEIFNKYSREYSKQDGLWIAVSPEAHEKVHTDHALWLQLKVKAQLKWLTADWTRSIQDFVDRYGRNYIDI